MPTFGPRFPTRLTAGRFQLLRAGLRIVLWASWSLALMSGDDPDKCQCVFCAFHRELLSIASMFGHAADQQRYRFRFNIVQILFLQLAARNILHPTRAIRKDFHSVPTTARLQGIATTLESLRKRAKREFQRSEGLAAYDDLRAVWTDYLDCLRQKLSGRLPWFLREPKVLRTPRFGTLVIDGLIRSVTPKLQDFFSELPDQAKLRSITRLFLRYIRRGRINLWIRDCVRTPDDVAPQLAAFIHKRM